MGLKNIVLGIAIMILTISVVIYGVNTIYAEPKYEDFCPQSNVPYAYGDKGERICPSVCVEMYEIVNGTCTFNDCGSGCGVDGITTFNTSAMCQMGLDGKNCYGLFDDASKIHSRNIFLIALPVGIAIIALGALIFGLEAVGAGLMGGGVGIMLWGVGGFWRFTDNWLKFVLSLVALVVVIWLSYYFNRKFGDKEKTKMAKNRSRGFSKEFLIIAGIVLLLAALIGLGTIVKIILVLLGAYLIWKGIKK